LGATLINYFSLPIYYKKKYVQFIGTIILILFSMVLIDEQVLEQIFFPLKRGKSFMVFYALLQALPSILILVGFKFAWDASLKQNELEKVKKLMVENELQFLKSQINPHFLFNNLNNIYAYAIENSPKTPQIILELSTVLRYMIYDCREEFVLIGKELEHLRHFVNLNKLQMEERGSITLNIQDETQQKYIAPLILIVFVENAFKHSLSSQVDDIQIFISVRIEGNTLFFECKNTFFAQGNTQNLHQGVGLKNVIAQLNLLYSDAYQLNINEQDNWYEVSLQITLNQTIT